ncbi:MAG: hypothetical protein QXT63_07475 [Thermoplasmata archaeon]
MEDAGYRALKKSPALVVISSEVQLAWNDFMHTFEKNRLVIAWFIIQLLLVLLFMVKQLEYRDIYVDPRTFLLLFFFVFLIKSMSDFSTSTIKSRENIILYSQPVNPTSILIGKVGAILLFNMGLFAAGAGWTTLVMLIIPRLGIDVEPTFFVSLILLMISATFGGATFSVLTSIPNKKKRIIYTLAYSQLFTTMLYILQFTDIPGIMLLSFLSFVVIITILIIFRLGKVTMEAWDFQISAIPSQSLQKRILGSRFLERLSSYMDDETRPLFKKEITLDLKDRETYSMLISTIVISISLLFVDYAVMKTKDLLGPFEKLSFIRPIIVGLGIFMCCTIGYSMKTVSSISKEGKAIWISKTLPVCAESIMKSKAYSTLIFLPITIIAIAFPIPIYEYFGQWHVLLFAILGTMTISFTYTGIGLFMGAKFPSSSGSPDLVTLYNTTIATLVMGLILEGIPLRLIAKDVISGLLSSFVALGWGLVILHNCVHFASRAFEELEF